LKGKTAADIPDGPREATFLTGCALLFRTSLLRSVGMLDTDYFFYGEDIDYDLRVIQSGHSLLYVPQASVWHKIVEVAKDRTSPYVLYHLARGTALLFRKCFSPPYRWYAYGVQFVLYTPFRAWQILRGGAGMASLRAWVGGLLDGINGRPPAPRT
jgi:GT2 family glycosyltransferase